MSAKDDAAAQVQELMRMAMGEAAAGRDLAIFSRMVVNVVAAAIGHSDLSETRARAGQGVGYGPGWHAARKAATERDRVCVNCGSDENLEVHHIRPLRLFRRKSDAHALSNLKLLCRSCHAEADRLFRATEATQ